MRREVGDGHVQLQHAVDTEPARNALVGERRVEKPVADDVGASRERRTDHALRELGPRRREQRRLRPGRRLLAVEQQPANLLPSGVPPGSRVASTARPRLVRCSTRAPPASTSSRPRPRTLRTSAASYGRGQRAETHSETTSRTSSSTGRRSWARPADKERHTRAGHSRVARTIGCIRAGRCHRRCGIHRPARRRRARRARRRGDRHRRPVDRTTGERQPRGPPRGARHPRAVRDRGRHGLPSRGAGRRRHLGRAADLRRRGQRHRPAARARGGGRRPGRLHVDRRRHLRRVRAARARRRPAPAHVAVRHLQARRRGVPRDVGTAYTAPGTSRRGSATSTGRASNRSSRAA